MKLYDFDGLFDEKLKDYMAKRAGKYGESALREIRRYTFEEYRKDSARVLRGDERRGAYKNFTGAP